MSFDIENAPKPTRTMEPPKKKEKKTKVAADAAAADTTASKVNPVAAEVDAKKTEKKDKKDKNEPKERKNEGAAVDAGGKKASNKGGGAATEATTPVPSMIDLRVGHILDGADLVSRSSTKLISEQYKSILTLMGFTLRLVVHIFCLVVN